MKLAKDLQPGDRVRMADGKIRTVADLARGIATFVMEDGKRKHGVMIGWAEGRAEFSTVPIDQQCAMEGDPDDET